MNGKGDSPRNCFSEEYRENYDDIFRKDTMTTEQIKQRIKEIEETAWDDEVAHKKEAAMRADFIAYVASLENKALAAKAKLVLSTDKIAFSRWYA